jgi:hypothetical protein
MINNDGFTARVCQYLITEGDSVNYWLEILEPM